MKRHTLAFTFALAVTAGLDAPALAAQTRCGWLQNPTPGNWWLTDNAGAWTIMTQGADNEPEGMDLIPDISTRDYVRTNGNYGYACACMSVETGKDDRIAKILTFRQLPLSKCQKDKSLPAPE